MQKIQEKQHRQLLKAKHDGDQEAIRAVEQQKKVSADERKLRASKQCMDSTMRTAASRLDKLNRTERKETLRAHGEDAAARKRY